MKLSDDAPLLALIDRPLEDMTEAELFAHVQALQEASSNVQAMKAKIIPKTKVKDETQRKQQIKSVITDLLS